MAELVGYEAETFEADGAERVVFRAGSGPAVLVITEVPGITPSVAAFGLRVAEAGFTAVLPSLFGEPGREPTPGYIARTISWACVSKEFATWARNKTSPATAWARALARHEHERCGGPGVGVVGMCLTGNFALAMMVDPVVLAPVLSQPSLPFALTPSLRRDVNLAPDDLAAVKARCEAEDDLCVLGLRFTGDWMAPHERFARLSDELGDSFVGVEIDSSKGNSFGIRRAAHSVLTEDLVDEVGHPTHDALEQVLELFRRRLLAT
ncbi:MAG: dienelactone hydrolase family protein [Acidimicrobiales bacterium]|nr:dienelactone hydrolase family protein [Acidimicrobiales bacterium]